MAVNSKTNNKKPTATGKPSPKATDDLIGASLKEEFAAPPEESTDYDDDDDDDGLLGDDVPWYEKYKIPLMIGAGILVAAIILVIYLFNQKPEAPPPAPTPVATPAPSPTPDPRLAEIQGLYEKGIGKEYVDDANLYAQGNIESNKFRKDFHGDDQPEMFKLPVKISVVRDGVSYIKHRAVTADGIECYWLEAEFKGRPCTFTIPYSIYQAIQPSGVIDVEVEVVTDANGSQTITNFTAIPPSQVNKKK